MKDVRVRRSTIWRIGVILTAALMLGAMLSVYLPHPVSAADAVNQAAPPVCGNGICETGEDVCTCSADCTGTCAATTGAGTTGATDAATGTTGSATTAGGPTTTGGTTDGAAPTTGGTTDSTTTGGTTDSAAPTTVGTTDAAGATTGAGDASGTTDGSAATTGGTGAAPSDTAGPTPGGGDVSGALSTGGSTTAGSTTGGTTNSADPTSGLTNGSATGTTGSAGESTSGSTTSGGSGIERLDPRRPDGSIDPMHPTMLLVWVGILIFAAVAIPAFMKNARKAKTAEAVTNVKARVDRLPPSGAKVSKVDALPIKQNAQPDSTPQNQGIDDLSSGDPMQEHIKKAVLYGRKSGDDKRQDYMKPVDPNMPDDFSSGDPMQEHIKKAVLHVRKAGNDPIDYDDPSHTMPTDVANPTVAQPRSSGIGAGKVSTQDLSNTDEGSGGEDGGANTTDEGYDHQKGGGNWVNNNPNPVEDHKVGGGILSADPSDGSQAAKPPKTYDHSTGGGNLTADPPDSGTDRPDRGGWDQKVNRKD